MSDIEMDNAEEHQMMVDMFVSNALEQLDQIENDLMTLESQGGNFDTNLVNKVFRAAHTIKGESGFINLKTVGKLAHAIEEVLDKMRDRELLPTSNTVSVLLHGFDDLRNLIQEIETSESVDVSGMVQSLKEVLQKKSESKTVAPALVSPVKPVVEVVTTIPSAKPVAVPLKTIDKPSSIKEPVTITNSKKSKAQPALVLIIDDDPLMCELLAHHLNKGGISIDVAVNAQQAREKMHQSFYRVVLCDINLGIDPSKQNKITSGIDLITDLKQIYPLTQILMLTGNVTAPNVLNSIEKGATDFISKRDSYDRIVSTVKETLVRAERWSPLMLGSNN
jgi:chemotaxis protein histidine kinase CheA